VENGEHVWGAISNAVASAAYKKGLLKSDEVVTLPSEEIAKHSPLGEIIWGANSRATAIRARKLLKWTPRGASLEDTIPEAVEEEARRMGLVEGHASKVAG
jgi:hypothetical protein